MSLEPTTLTSELYQYMLDVSLRETKPAQELRERASALAEANWQTPPEQAQFVALLAKIIGARRILEVGTFVGYGTLWMADAVPPDGCVTTIDIVETFPDIGRPFWHAAGVADRIDLRIGDAVDVLHSLIEDEQMADGYDLAFIDANKRCYPQYYEACLTLVRPGGVILIDNVFWDGAVIDAGNDQPATKAIRQINQTLHHDPRVDISMIAIADGLTIARKLD